MGVYFLGSLIAFALVVYWAWRNDAVPLDGETTGWFRMRQFRGPESAAGGSSQPADPNQANGLASGR